MESGQPRKSFMGIARRWIVHILIMEQLNASEAQPYADAVGITSPEKHTSQQAPQVYNNFSNSMLPDNTKVASHNFSPDSRTKEPFRWIIFDENARPPFDAPEAYKTWGGTFFKIAKGICVYDLLMKTDLSTQAKFKKFSLGGPGAGILKAGVFTYGATNLEFSPQARASMFLWNAYSAQREAAQTTANLKSFNKLHYDFKYWARRNSKTRWLAGLGVGAQIGETALDIYSFYARTKILCSGEGDSRTAVGAIENLAWLANSAGIFMELLHKNPGLANRLAYGGAYGALTCRVLLTIMKMTSGKTTLNATTTPIDQNNIPIGPDNNFEDTITTDPRLLEPKPMLHDAGYLMNGIPGL